MNLRHRYSAASAAFIAILLVAPFASAKRSAPTEVPPVVSANVRYEVPHVKNPCGQAGGCLVAYDNTSSALLWSVEVYCTHYDSNIERDVQDVFITSLSLENGQLLVANEKGQHFAIDPATHQVTGDARGCDTSSWGGCQHLPARPYSPPILLLTVLGFLMFTAMRWNRKKRSEKASRP
jgi:hypothetical protein